MCEIDVGEFERRADYFHQWQAVLPSKHFRYDQQSDLYGNRFVWTV